MDQKKRIRWLDVTVALVVCLLMFMALLPSTGMIRAGPAHDPNMWRCGPFVYYPVSFFGVLGTVAAVTALTVFGIVRRNWCESTGWFLLGLLIVLLFVV
jgi:polyferredoxin